MTRGLDNCLFGYPMDEWKRLEEKLKALPVTKKDARAFTRFFFSGATEVELDKQGRINIPSSLLQYAKVEKDCVVLGVSGRIEIWAKPFGMITTKSQSNHSMKSRKILLTLIFNTKAQLL